MSDARWERIKSIFNQAMELPAAQRQVFVEQTSDGDIELLKEVRSLLESARPTKDPGAMRTGGAAGAVPDMSTASFGKVILKERPGTTVGPYKLLQPIGEGGFGMVFLAEQTVPVRRRVALKVIKLGMDTKAVIARFEAERQALALMDHPHIARVLDGGATETGRPYFVMEYVVGEPITKFADERKLTVSDRLELFAQVCSAVQHAHTKGVIHRDIKPANVLVSMVDGKPFAKVIDFGIAKATASPLTDKTLFTEHKQLIGTPEYMSPEQAEGSADIDTRTDVYALGVLLYELLTGATPFDGQRLRSAAWGEMQRIIREEEPPMPSVRLNRDQIRDQAKMLLTAAARAEEPARLGTRLKGELDWIVMKALDKDRARRYESPNQLAADVQRHLAGDAVVAAPVSKAYRLRKFVRRNRGPVLAGCAVALALVAGMAVATWQWKRAESLNVEAQRFAEQAGYNSAKAQLAKEVAEWNAYRANIALTQTSIAVDNWSDTRRSLLEAPKDKRGWEWELLQRQAEETIFARSNWQGGLFSPDGAWVVPNDSFGEKVVSTDNCAEQRLGAVGSEMCWSPDSRAFVVWAGDSAGVWTLRDGAWRSSGTISANARHSDRRSSTFVGSRWYAACTEDGNVHIWDLENLRVGKPISSINLRPGGGYVDIKASQVGLFVVRAISDDRLSYELQVWKVTDAALLERVNTLAESEDTVLIDMTRDGRHVLAAKQDTGFVWSKSADERYELAATLTNLDFSKGSYIDPTGNYVVAGNGDPRRLSRWNLRQSGTIMPERLDTGLKFGPVAAVAFDAASHQIIVGGYDSAGRFEWPSLAMIDRWGGSRTTEHTYTAGALNEWPETLADGNRLLFTGGFHWMSSTGSAWLGSPDIGRGTEFTINKGPNYALWLTAILASAPKGQSGLHINTPDGSRMISAGRDGSVRFAVPDINGSGVSRELAVFRMSGPVTNLQITGDGTRLIIELADGSARVWDIRNPSERRKDVQAAWAERISARKYLDQLWAMDTPDDALRSAVINDGGLSPLRRLVTAEMLEERFDDDRYVARQTLQELVKIHIQAGDADLQGAATDADYSSLVKSRVIAAAEKSTLPPRSKRQLIKMASELNYERPQPSSADKLAEQTKRADLASANELMYRLNNLPEDMGMGANKLPLPSEIRSAYQSHLKHLGPLDPKTLGSQNATASALLWRGETDAEQAEGLAILLDYVGKKEATITPPDDELIRLWMDAAIACAERFQFAQAEPFYAKLAVSMVPAFDAGRFSGTRIPEGSALGQYVSVQADNREAVVRLANQYAENIGETLRARVRAELPALVWRNARMSPAHGYAAEYHRAALRMARNALQLDAGNPLTYRAVALVKARQLGYQDALNSLATSEQLAKAASKPLPPAQFLIAAIAHHGLGHVDEARAALSQAKVLLAAQAEWPNDQGVWPVLDSATFLAEIETLIEGPKEK